VAVLPSFPLFSCFYFFCPTANDLFLQILCVQFTSCLQDPHNCLTDDSPYDFPYALQLFKYNYLLDKGPFLPLLLDRLKVLMTLTSEDDQ